MYPEPHAPSSGTFVEQQIKGLREIGLNVDVLYLNRRQKGMSVYFDLPKRLRTEIKKFQPDVVHAMYGGVMADRVTRTVNDRPTVVTFHGSDLLGEHLSGTVRKLIAGYGVRASWNAARRAQRVVTVSRTLRDVLPNDIRQSKVNIIPNGIDLTRFKPLDRDRCLERLKWDADTFHILFPANSGDPVKRPELAEAAVRSLQQRGILAEMHYLRGVQNEEVPVWLNASNVLLLTSLHEGSPTIVKEALACDLPVVSVDVGDVSERISDIEGCYIALPNQNDLAAKLFLVHAGKGKVNGRDTVKEFSLECIACQLRSVYAEALQFSNERDD
jgi:teichuronic acid biosynthesis glycosyltransferase TuaC